MKKISSLLCGLMLLGAASSASANLVVNGGFEAEDVPTNSWKWFASSAVDGWDGSNIEIWDNYNNFPAFEGSQHAELNAHPSSSGGFSIFQNIVTEANSVYTLSFAYAARTTNNEAFSYAVADATTNGVGILQTQVISNLDTTKWTVFTTSFTAVSNLTNIVFTAVRPLTATVGNFLDDVKLVADDTTNQNNVSAPGAIAVFLMSVGAMVFMRRRAKR